MNNPKILRDNRDFKVVYSKGKSLENKYLVFLYRINKCGYNRRAFLASKKVGNAVERNRARRLMKESFRLIAKVDFEQVPGPGSGRCGPSLACVMRVQRDGIRLASRRASSARRNPPALDSRHPTSHNAR